jgi:hypothetical protein
MLRVFKVRLCLTVQQHKLLDGQFGAVRFCYVKALAIKNHSYTKKGFNLFIKKRLSPCWQSQKNHAVIDALHYVNLPSVSTRPFLRTSST